MIRRRIVEVILKWKYLRLMACIITYSCCLKSIEESTPLEKGARFANPDEVT